MLLILLRPNQPACYLLLGTITDERQRELLSEKCNSAGGGVAPIVMASQTTTTTARGVSRVLEKLENSIKEGNYYEAHQMYRTLYFRYLTQKKYDELMDLLSKGALLFLENDQQGSGADLGILLLDVLEKSECRAYAEWSQQLSKIFAKISSSIPERDSFLAKAIRWSSADGIHGHPMLHQNLAQVFWNEKNYSQARYHYLHSRDGQGCARLLIELQSSHGYTAEVDLFIAQAVLQFLCLRNKSTANQTFTSYTQHHPSIKKNGPPYLLPLLNFIWFLLRAIESQKLATFTVLCEQYEPSIRRDPCYVQYLDKIGQIFFGVQPPPTPSGAGGGGLFGNFLQSFLGGLGDDDDESDESESSSARTHRPSASSSSTSSSGNRKPIENTELD